MIIIIIIIIYCEKFIVKKEHKKNEIFIQIFVHS